MIEAVIDRITASLPASRGDNLTGFVEDADHFFQTQGAFKSVSIERGADPRSLVSVALVLAPSVDSLQAITAGLDSAWQALSYMHFQASAVTWYQEATVLRFVTVISGDLFQVTGTATVTGPQYGALVERFERDFKNLNGPLPRLRKASRQPSNHAIQPSVCVVTPREVARAAPTQPAADRGRWTTGG